MSYIGDDRRLLLEKFCEVRGIKPSYIMQKTREASIVFERKLFFYIALEITNATTVELGRMFGMSHCTVLFHKDTIKNSIGLYEDVTLAYTTTIGELLKMGYMRNHNKCINVREKEVELNDNR